MLRGAAGGLVGCSKLDGVVLMRVQVLLGLWPMVYVPRLRSGGKRRRMTKQVRETKLCSYYPDRNEPALCEECKEHEPTCWFYGPWGAGWICNKCIQEQQKEIDSIMSQLY